MNVPVRDWVTALGRLSAQLVASWLCVIAALVGMGTLLTGPAQDEWPLTEEDELNQALAAGRTPTWDDVSHWWSMAGDTFTIIIGCLIVGIVLRLALHRWREAIFVNAAVVGAVVVMVTTSLFIDRERPDVEQLDVAPATSSFPSGHTGASLALYVSVALVVLWHVRRRWLAWLTAIVLLAVPVLVAYARLYRGMHHPSDLIGALVNASACLTIAWALVLRRARLPEDRARSTRRIDAGRDVRVSA